MQAKTRPTFGAIRCGFDCNAKCSPQNNEIHQSHSAPFDSWHKFPMTLVGSGHGILKANDAVIFSAICRGCDMSSGMM